MKALVCGACADIRALPSLETLHSSLTDWVRCRCGNCEGRWVDPHRGTATFRAAERDKVFVLGLNNDYFIPAIGGRLKMFEDMRAAHERPTRAPDHVFDASRAACWAVVFTIGASSDTSWTDGLPGDKP